MLSLDSCPICSERERTDVCEYNRFVINGPPPEPGAETYHYMLCHGCGLVYASHRPDAAGLRYLLDNFEDSLGRRNRKKSKTAPLDDERRAELRAQLDAGEIEIPEIEREHAGEHLEFLLERLPTSSIKRIVEVRTKSGVLPAELRDHLDAEVYAMPMFELHQLLVQELLGVPADHLIDFEGFNIPYEGQFDLIICKHMLTHVIDPAEFLAAVRAKLAPGGWLYMYAEATDHGWPSRKNLFALMNPFHLQTFDDDTYSGLLEREGFDVQHVAELHGHTVWLSRFDPEAAAATVERMDESKLADRLAYYDRWRAYSIVNLPKRIGEENTDELFAAGERERATERGLKEGWLYRTEKGRIKAAPVEKTPA